MEYLREVIMTNKEIWKPIKGYEGYYEISNMGRVKSLERMVPYSVSGFFRKQYKFYLKAVGDGYGYLFVCLHKKGIKKYKKIHQLVASAFVRGERDGLQVNHKNGIITDNSPENLEWVTPRENTLHAIEVLGKRRDKENHWKHKITIAQVEEMRELYKTGKYSQVELAKRYGIHRGQLSKICNHKAWT